MTPLNVVADAIVSPKVPLDASRIALACGVAGRHRRARTDEHVLI
jgi:hypothetical protein